MPLIRPATVQDAAGCAAIYAPYVAETAISFETQAPDAAAMAARIATARSRWVWLVAVEPDHDGGCEQEVVVGYAYGSEFRSRAAYRWSCEVSVYVDRSRRRSGLGRALYEELLTRLAARGYRTAVAGMTLPNEASVGLHTVLGFEPVGVHRRIGRKLGRWHDVAWMQRPLGDYPDSPAEPG